MSTNKETTTVATVDMDLDSIVAESVATSAANIVIPPIVKIERLGDDADPMDALDEEEEPEITAATDDIDNIIAEAQDQVAVQTPNKGGRPAVTKDLLLDVIGQLAEDGVVALFDDGKELKDYSKEDLIDLIKVNIEDKEKKFEQEVPLKFFDSLPEKLQYAAKYVAEGGTDLEALFSTLLQQERIEKLDMDAEAGQLAATRQYLEITNFGTREEIDEQLTEWQDRGELPKKANQFKPKLEARAREITERQVKEQEARRKQHEQASEAYVANIYDTLKGAEINGIKLDKKTQAMLYTGLVNANYKSYTGQPTNLLGHLLEKYQVIEPNHELIAEVLWHLSDPKGFKEELKKDGKKGATAETVRQLKTEQNNRTGSTSVEPVQKEVKKVARTVSRPGGNFKFERA